MADTDLTWIKATASMGAGACVELADAGGSIRLRNSRHPDLEISYTKAEIIAFFAGVRAGEFDYLINPE